MAKEKRSVYLTSGTTEIVTITPRKRKRLGYTPAPYDAIRIRPKRSGGSVCINAKDARRMAQALSTPEDLKRLADHIGRAAYFADVRAHADSILEDLRDGTIADREALIERIDQDADGAARVIYTAQAMETLIYSDHDGAYAEEFGTEGIVSDGSINWSVLAYAAFRADIQEQVAAHVDINRPFKCADCAEGFENFADLLQVPAQGDQPAAQVCADCSQQKGEV